MALVSFFSTALSACGLPEDPSEVDPPQVQPPGGSARLYYAVTKVEGTYGGGAQKVMGAGWVDTAADVRCRFSSPGTVATQKPFVGDPAHDTWSKGLTVNGRSDCPPVAGTSTSTDPCEAGAHVQSTLFQWTVDVTGWDDAAEVVLHATAPSVLPYSCNHAAVLGEQGHPWGLVARTTLKKFRGGIPFEVRFLGSNTLSFDGNTSEVGWDLTVTIAPQK